MRKTRTLEAYLDDYNLVNIFVSKNYYQGNISEFYLTDDLGNSYELVISGQSSDHPTHNEYYCQLKDEIVFGVKYIVHESNAKVCPLEIGFITKNPKFDETYKYSGPLGVISSDSKTEFYLWAPTATKITLVLNEDNYYNLKREAKGVYHLALDTNHHLSNYYYLVEINGQIRKSLDPYAICSNRGSTSNIIVDFTKITLEDKVVPNENIDKIILESSIRDFTSGLDIENKGTFAAFGTSNLTIENKKVGFDYLCELGISHLQLMPVNDFATVDEFNTKRFYNWGYDPKQYFSLEGSYGEKNADPTNIMLEFYNLCRKLHQNNLKVCLDVVFNHIYEIETSALDITAPYYYFRYNNNKSMSNGSYCGNDLDSKAFMFRRYIIDVLSFFVKFYDIDGFRFDLMGILDIETMKEIETALKKLKPNIYLYGEGWWMPTAIDDSEKACLANADKLINYSFFNDYLRDIVKGKGDYHSQKDLGFLTGDYSKLEDFKNALCGNNPHSNASTAQLINYTECHDNYTLWDKIKLSCHLDSKELRIKKHKLVIASTLLAKGTPFLQLGQEFCRSKNNIDNSYNSSDSINTINWKRAISYSDVVEYTKELIRIRKDHEVLRKNDVLNSFELIDNALLWNQSVDNKVYVVAFNPTDNVIKKTYDHKVEVIFCENKKDNTENTIVISPYSCVIYIL
ncbi:MAG: type I pullulanase [Anaerorhabdus sp.]